MRTIAFTLFTLMLILAGTGQSLAQQGIQNQNLPTLPEPIQALVNEGAQIRYLGQVNGLDGWVTIRQGQEQYFYVTPDQQNFVMGVLFGEDGRMLTIDQVQSLRENEGEVLDMLTADQMPDRPRLDELAEQATSQVGQSGQSANAGQAARTSPTQNGQFDVQSPAEQLYADMQQSNWVALGDSDAPYIYSVMDPQCPHCHAFSKDLRQYIENGELQVRIVPIGLREETRAQAAYLLASPNPQDIWYRHLNGDAQALPATGGINQQGVQHNLSVVQNWEVDVTPFSVYRGQDGSIKIVRGRADDPQSILNDVAGSS